MVMRTDRRTARAVDSADHLTVTRPPRRPGVARPPMPPGPFPSRPGPSAPRSAPLPPLPPTVAPKVSPTVSRPVRRPSHQAFGADPHYAPSPKAAGPTTAQVARVRRAVALVLVAPVTLAVVVLLGQLAHVAQAAAVPDRTVAVRVAEGESLWQLARRAAPQADAGAVVERIVEVNGLESAAVWPGQVVLVPTS
ncbi:MAG: Peptidoglycan-binding lysin domain protein [Pseudonocardia sp.]|nr:Peptidoglycan-binding lysin domain protein [Pseudonocardia sp.]